MSALKRKVQPSLQKVLDKRAKIAAVVTEKDPSAKKANKIAAVDFLEEVSDEEDDDGEEDEDEDDDEKEEEAAGWDGGDAAVGDDEGGEDDGADDDDDEDEKEDLTAADADDEEDDDDDDDDIDIEDEFDGEEEESEEGQKQSGAKKVRDAAPGFGLSDAMSKILARTSAQASAKPILAKAKGIERKLDEARLEESARRALTLEKKSLGRKDRVKPDPSGMDYEKKLRKMATRGIIKLFNAINQAQKSLSTAPKVAESQKTEAAKKAKSNFMELLKEDSVAPKPANAMLAGIGTIKLKKATTKSVSGF